jgi:hypothetical protein
MHPTFVYKCLFQVGSEIAEATNATRVSIISG